MSKNRSMTKRACSGFVHVRPVSARSLSPLLDGLLRADLRAAAAVQAEHLQSIPGVARVDGLHIGVFFKDLVQLFLADISNLSPKGDRSAQGAFW